MTFKLKSLPFAISCAIASGALVAGSAIAQTTEGSGGTTAQTPQRVVVTGSMISRADRETPSPVQVLTAEDIVRSGYTSTAEVLSNLTANGNGSLSQSFAGAFATGAGGVSLRGLTVGATLVLIDGHRMAPYPIGDDGQRQFVDVSNIPFDAIERIEVLKDGASSLYGSDAIAGVINVILKKSFKGTKVGAEYGQSQKGGGSTTHATVTHGFGDIDTDGYNFFVTGEVRDATAIRQNQRSGDWNNPDWTRYGGINVTRGVPNAQNAGRVAASVPFLFDQRGLGINGRPATENPANFTFLTPDCDFAKYRAGGCAVEDKYSFIQPPSQNANLLVGLTNKLNENWTLTTKASVFKNHVRNNRGVPLTFTTGTGSFGGNIALEPGGIPQIVQEIPSFLAPANYPGNPYGHAVRLYGYIPGLPGSNSVDVKNTSYRVVTELSGTAGDYDINAALGFTKVVNDIEYSGYLNRQALYDAMMRPNNPLLATNPLSAEDRAAISPTYSNTKTSRLSFAELRAGRSFFDLPGGKLGVSAGVSFVEKKYDSPPPALTILGLVGNTAAFAYGKENNSAAFFEIAAPILKNLEIDVSGRYDHYSTYGNSKTPKAGFKFTPFKALTLRGAYSRGFRAPGPAENGTAGSVFQAGSIDDPVLCANGNPETAGNVVAACNFAVAGVQGTTKDLRPERSVSKTFGLIIEPVRGWSSTLDYYNVTVKDQIIPASALPDYVPTYVRFNPLPTPIADGNGGTFIGTPAVGQIAYQPVGYVNAGSVKTSGVEFETGYRFRLGEYGNLRPRFQFTHMISYEITDPSGNTVQVAGTHGPNSVGGNTGTPKDRAALSLDWDRGPLSSTLTMNWVSDFSLLDPTAGFTDCYLAIKNEAGRQNFFNTSRSNPPPNNFCRVGSFMTFDLNMRYKLTDKWTIQGSILNLFDRQPPIDVGTYGNASVLTAYNPAFHQSGAVGRFFNIGANYQF